MTNVTTEPQSFYLERSEWYTNAATAAEVTTLQHFRDLFSDEVLRPGEEIGIRSLTILFSDLVGSTAMYNRIGDAPSYAVVREQFAYLQRIVRRYDGAIVKTIGDAIMGAFVNPVRAVNAALAIQQSIDELHRAYPNSPLTIRLGLHIGPCIAVNLNGRLDYFGTTVNLASRLETLSQGGDIIISKAVYSDPAVEALLAAKAVQVEPFQTSIKGFDEGFELYRLTLKSEPTTIELERLKSVITHVPADDSVPV
jgi:class 3 adenylate cyclase